jgi:hypothetical protein
VPSPRPSPAWSHGSPRQTGQPAGRAPTSLLGRDWTLQPPAGASPCRRCPPVAEAGLASRLSEPPSHPDVPRSAPYAHRPLQVAPPSHVRSAAPYCFAAAMNFGGEVSNNRPYCSSMEKIEREKKRALGRPHPHGCMPIYPFPHTFSFAIGISQLKTGLAPTACTACRTKANKSHCMLHLIN